MDGWNDRHTDGWMMDGWNDRQTGRMDLARRIDTCTNSTWMDGWIDG